MSARTLVKNHWRTKTTSSVFLVRIHVWLTIAPAMVAVVCAWNVWRKGRQESGFAIPFDSSMGSCL
jgi:hypothetical protein